MQKTSYEMRISDWRSDVCSSDLPSARTAGAICSSSALAATFSWCAKEPERGTAAFPSGGITREGATMAAPLTATAINCSLSTGGRESRSEEHTSELQSLMRSSYAVFCLKKKNYITHHNNI